ncbi:hypothetical protein THAOC_04986 [Thalassiosira oceanica]|uniref:Uncharacterized protein n=1 Tax=Thalassiosira oceanica TaxID=159749 RepID=K0T8E5_THAOC|nr:hypothetical protein THAOC_04986 [Thalassiosira oceanica]|eukprot:EJK73394.1 hypothetical protein THAOC_04986 [Thalassiosira oceanica]
MLLVIGRRLCRGPHLSGAGGSYHSKYQLLQHLLRRPLSNSESPDSDPDSGGSYDWLPPDDSPVFGAYRKHQDARDPSIEPAGTGRSRVLEPEPDTGAGVLQDEEVIEVIDLEATLRNETNQQILDAMEDEDEIGDDIETDDGFSIESSTSNWKDLLKELKEDGQNDMLDNLVEEYGLQSFLDDMDDEELNVNAETDETPLSNDDEWNEDVLKSVEGLSQDDIIDELIECSPSLSQLELEMLSESLGDEGELDSLKGTDMENTYSDFRKMVWEDYQARLNGSGNEDHVLRTQEKNAFESAKNGSSDLPSDWHDFDSSAAFKQDFSAQEENLGEIDPSAGDPSTSGLDNTIDWLQARRKRLGESDENSRPTHLFSPDEAESFRHRNSHIPVQLHTLFTPSELSVSLTALGATDVKIIDVRGYDKYGSSLGCDYMLLATGRNVSHLRVLAESVVRNLRSRRLNERGVPGASGPEGGRVTNKRSLKRNKIAGVSSSGKFDDEWFVVDCENVHVHILDKTARSCLRLESLWDLSDPNSEGSKLRRLDLNNEDAVDEFVAANPVPDEYAASVHPSSANHIQDGDGRIDVVTVNPNPKSFSARWSGELKGKSMKKHRR